MSRVKTTTSKLLALFMAAVLVCSTLGSVTAVADTQGTASGSADAADCGIGGSSYESTSSLDENDKSDSTQANVQETTGVTTSTIADALYQSAEWTNKATGEAGINIHYEADLSKQSDEIRSLYVLTNCHNHSFEIGDAVSNVLYLLETNDYVDVIVIVADSLDNDSDCTFAMEFSVSADQFNSIDSTEEKEAILTGIFSPTTTTHFTSGTESRQLYAQQYAHELGATGTTYNNTNGSFHVLTEGHILTNDEVQESFPTNYGRHCGVYYSIYYINRYINTITTNYPTLSFDSVVQYIINSFDAFVPAVANATDRSNHSSTSITDLCNQVNQYVGVNLTSSSMSIKDLNTYFEDAVQVILDYDSNGRYVVLVPDTESNGAYAVSAVLSSGAYYSETRTVNELLYLMFYLDPTRTWNNEEGVREELAYKIENVSAGTTSYSPDDFPNAWRYDVGVEELDILNISPDKSFRITATITSEFELITDSSGETDITVSNLSGTGTSFDYDISTSGGSGSNTVVTITITNLAADSGAGGLYDADTNPEGVSEWTIDVSIPVKLVAGTMSFRDTTDDEDAFKETNAANTSAVVYSTNEGTGGGQDYVYETVTVASPKLYRSAGSLTVSKTVEGTSDTTTEFDFEVTLPSVSGTFYYYTGTYDENSTTYGSITFTNGEITAVDDDPDTKTISLKHEESFTIVGLLTDVAYTVTESAATGYYAKNIDVKASSSNLTEATDSALSDGSYYVDTTRRTATTKILAADETVTVTYTNTNTFDLVIWKYTGEDTSLGGATFSVAALSASGEAGTSNTLTATDSTSGKTTASSLSVGTVYKVEETQAVSGYNILSDSFYIMVGSDGKLVLTNASGTATYETAVSGAVSIGSSTGTFQVNVSNTLNTTTLALPTTGGSGTLPITVLGVVLVALAAYALYRQRHGSMYAHAAHAVSNAVASPWQARAASRPQPTRRRVP